MTSEQKTETIFWGVFAIFITSIILAVFYLASDKPQVSSITTETTFDKTSVSLNDFSKAIYSATNAYRIDNGINTLNLDSKLTEAAKNKADDLCERDYWSHDLPDGTPWNVFIDKSGYDYTTAGENLGKGYDDPDKLMEDWKASSLHNKNLLQDFTDTGIGYSECDGKKIIAVEFGK